MGRASWSRSGAIVIMVATLGAAFAPALARADGSDKVTAEALFNEGKRLMNTGHVAEACPKFAASQQLDPGVGTLLNLAVCYETNGQTASAWAAFKEAATAAAAAGQAPRATMARQRAAALEPMLPKLTLNVDLASLPDGFELRRDGAVVPQAAWGIAVPVDPGEHVLDARAPKRKPFNSKIKIAARESQTVTVGPLEKEPEPPPPPPPPSASVAPPPPPPASASVAQPPPPPSASATPPANASATPHPPLPPQAPPHGGLQTTFGSIGVAVGGIGLIGGGFAALGAKLTYDGSNAVGKCQNDQCTQKGLDARDNAYTFGTIATFGVIGGAVLLATGIVLLATVPTPKEAPPPAALRVVPAIGRGYAGVGVGGAW